MAGEPIVLAPSTSVTVIISYTATLTLPFALGSLEPAGKLDIFCSWYLLSALVIHSYVTVCFPVSVFVSPSVTLSEFDLLYPYEFSHLVT